MDIALKITTAPAKLLDKHDAPKFRGHPKYYTHKYEYELFGQFF